MPAGSCSAWAIPCARPRRLRPIPQRPADLDRHRPPRSRRRLATRAPTTPRFDASRGWASLRRRVSTSSWTLPAHLSMLTGRSRPARRVDMRHGFNRSVPTVPALLRAAGFATRAVTSHLYVSGVYGLDDGFEHLDFRQDRKATEVADRGMDVLDRVGDRPFFVFLHLYDPHWHYDPPAWARRLFETAYAGSVTGNWQDFSRRDRAAVSDADLAHLLALYDGEIRYADTEGPRAGPPGARGLDRSTLVVITSTRRGVPRSRVLGAPEDAVRGSRARALAIRAPAGAAARAARSARWTSRPHPGLGGRACPLRDRARCWAARRARGLRRDRPHRGRHAQALPPRGRSRWKTILRSRGWKRDAGRNGMIFPPIPPSAERPPLPPWPIPYGGGRSNDGGRIRRWGTARPVCLSAEQQERLRALGYVSGGSAEGCQGPER